MDNTSQKTFSKRNELNSEAFKIVASPKTNMDILTRGPSQNEDVRKRVDENLELYDEIKKLCDENLPKSSSADVNQYITYLLASVTANNLRHIINADMDLITARSLRELREKVSVLEVKLKDLQDRLEA